MLRRIDAETERVDDLLFQRLRHLLAQQRDHSRFISSKNDVLDILVAHDLFEQVDNFLRVLEVIVLYVALVTRLRPPADLRLFRLHVFQLFMLNCASRNEDEDLRAIRVCEHDGITPVLIDKTRERIQMRSIGDKQSVAFERRVKQADYKPITVSRARKDRESLNRRRNLTFEVTHDANEVFVEALLLV